MEELVIKVIAPGKDIRDFSWVTKRTGMARYLVRRSICIYGPEVAGQPRSKQEIAAPEGHLFLCDDKGNINTWSEGKLFVWLMTPSEARAYIDTLENKCNES